VDENIEVKEKIEENTQAALALVLIVASVVRDFLVVEDRQSQFVARPAKRSRCATNQALSIIYLPRRAVPASGCRSIPQSAFPATHTMRRMM
jgi:hypothetical protein